MTNFDYYKEQIKAVGYSFGINENGKIVGCRYINPCNLCEFDETGFCSRRRIEWLYEEHNEQPKLTKNERKLCEILQEGYIARESNGVMAFYKEKPQKIRDMYWGVLGSYSNTISDYMFTDCNFSFITWEDEKPWSVKDLLKLEVME